MYFSITAMQYAITDACTFTATVAILVLLQADDFTIGIVGEIWKDKKQVGSEGPMRVLQMQDVVYVNVKRYSMWSNLLHPGS